jgi:hypothetical protein
MKKIILFFIPLIALIQACVLQDHNVQPIELVPESVKKIVAENFPNNSELTFYVLEKDRVFEAKFKLNGNIHSAIMSTTKLLNSTQSSGLSLPGDLNTKLAGLAIDGGVFSKYRQVKSTENQIFKAQTVNVVDYQFKGNNYTLEFSDTWYLTKMSEQYEKSYFTDNLSDLFEKIEKFIKERNKPNPTYIDQTALNDNIKNSLRPNNELTYGYGFVYIFPSDKKYVLTIRYFEITSLPMTFNENSNLVYSYQFDRLKQFNKTFDDSDNPSLAKINLTTDEINYFRNLFSTQTFLNGFEFGEDRENCRSEYEGIKSYQLFLKNGKGERWYLQFDANKNLVYKYYYQT